MYTFQEHRGDFLVGQRMSLTVTLPSILLSPNFIIVADQLKRLALKKYFYKTYLKGINLTKWSVCTFSYLFG